MHHIIWMKRRRNVQCAGHTCGNPGEAWFDLRWGDCPFVTHLSLSLSLFFIPPFFFCSMFDQAARVATA